MNKIIKKISLILTSLGLILLIGGVISSLIFSEQIESAVVKNLKEQIEEHKKNKGCFACHKSIDPYGFALENFDATGQWRTNYKIMKPHRGTFQFKLGGYFNMAGKVDSSGSVGNQNFKNIFDLKKIILSDHKKIAYNFTKKFFEYANGYKPSLEQRLVLYSFASENAEECRIKDLITKVLVYSLTGRQE